MQEVVLAVWLEAQISKDEILELYLNRVYFGAGACRHRSGGADNIFGKSARDVTLAEAAILAGVLKAPTTTIRRTDPDAAARRAAG